MLKRYAAVPDVVLATVQSTDYHRPEGRVSLLPLKQI